MIRALALALRSVASALLAGAGFRDAHADFWGVYYSARYSKRGRS